MHGPHRLVVRTSRRGRDNPGPTPGLPCLLGVEGNYQSVSQMPIYEM